MSLSYVFFGSPGFCLPVLEALERAGWPPRVVVCQPDRPQGRGCQLIPVPTKSWAQGQGLPILQPESCRQGDFLQAMRELDPDLGLVFAFGQILPRALLEIPRLGFINLHPSLLPRFRGAAPIQWTLIRGDPEAGVSIVEVTPRLDDGDILLQEAIPVDPDEDAVELGARLVELGARLVLEAFEQIGRGAQRPRPQDPARVVWAPALTREDGQVDWTQATADLHNRIRGVVPWPGAYTRLGSRRLKIHRARPVAEPGPGARPGPGVVIRAEGSDLWVATGDGVLRLVELQLEGKKRMDARAFLLGRPLEAGDRLGSAGPEDQIRAVEK